MLEDIDFKRNSAAVGLMFLDEFLTKDQRERFLENANSGLPYIMRFFEKTHESEFVSLAFNWSATEEGIPFWTDIDLRWQEHLNSKEVK